MLMPTVAPTRALMRMLCRHALGLAQDSAAVGLAWEDIHAAQILADWIDEEPFLITHLTSSACHGMIRGTILDILGTSGNAPNVPSLLQHELRALSDAPRKLELAAHAERLAVLPWIEAYVTRDNDWLDMVVAGGNAPDWVVWTHPWLTPILSRLARPRLFMELRACHDLHFEAALALREGGPDLINRLHAVKERAQSSTLMLPKIMFPEFESIASTDLAQRTERRAFVVALSAWEFRRTSGRWPDSPAMLSLPPDVLIDACSNLPLVFKTDATSVTVYGFGLDGDDHGGRALAPPGGKMDRDIVVRLRFPAPPTDRSP